MTTTHNSSPPLIVAFVGDLMFTTRIDMVVRHLGYAVHWVERAADIGEVDPDAPAESPGESLHGREGQLFRRVTEWQPALLLFDLTNPAIPWQKWIPMLKASPATRRFPILCFGPHEDVDVMQRAKSLGADAVLARSRFTADMPALFERYARVPDGAALQTTCAEPLSELAREGIELFNRREFYPCHDSLEAAWMADQSAGRDLYRGILQVGIAYYQIERGNYRGAAKMLLRVRQWLEPLPTVCRGVDVAQLRADADRVYEALTALGPERMAEFDRGLFGPIRLVGQA
jgi:predicted metal-dependent hydrolase